MATILLVGTQLIRERENPNWTAGARSISVQEAEKQRASTPTLSAPATQVSSIPDQPTPVAGSARTPQTERPEPLPVRDVLIQPQRPPEAEVVSGRELVAPQQSQAADVPADDDTPSRSIGADVREPGADRRPSVRTVETDDVEPRRGARLRKSSRTPSLRFAGRSRACGSRCTVRPVRNALPTRRNPIQFQLADRGNR